MTGSNSRPAIEIAINGEPRLVPTGSTVAVLLQELGRDPRTVAVELRGRIVRRHELAEVELRDGDRLEIVHFVQGGCPPGRRFRL